MHLFSSCFHFRALLYKSVKFKNVTQMISRKVSLYPAKGADCFPLFGNKVLPEPTKQITKSNAVSFFLFRSRNAAPAFTTLIYTITY